MFTNNILLKPTAVMLISSIMIFYSGLLLAEYEPFPGKREIKVIRLNSPIELVINFETWSGYHRTLTVQLRGLDIPRDTLDAGACERVLAAQVFGFAQMFINDSKKVYLDHLRMESSSDEFAYSHILTNQGSLSNALINKGLARPDTIDPKTSWCS